MAKNTHPETDSYEVMHIDDVRELALHRANARVTHVTRTNNPDTHARLVGRVVYLGVVVATIVTLNLLRHL